MYLIVPTQNFSNASFDSPCGLMGRGTAVSSIGTRSGGPKIAHRRKMIRRTPV
jgi:hypothetical protein